MGGLHVMFNADEILKTDIFNKKDASRQKKLTQIASIIKTRYSMRFQNCRFFFSMYPSDSTLKVPRIVKKYQWIHLNSLCFDNFKSVIEFDGYFEKEYNDFIKKSDFDELRLYESDNNLSFLIDYKAKVKRTISSEKGEIQEEPFHTGYLGMNEDGLMISIVNVSQ